MSELEAVALVAASVFAINLLPAFGPPTWAVLVLFSLHTDLDTVALVAVGAVSAASGRLLLARGSARFRDRLSEKTRANLQAANDLLSRRPGRSLAALAVFAVSPIGSAQLFVAAGLMRVRLLPLTAAFLAGRLVSYSFYVGGAAALSRTGTGQVLLSNLTSPWALLVELALLGVLVAFTRIDWTRIAGSGHPT